MDMENEPTVTVKTGRNDDLPNFAGPFVQGPAGERFVYIDIGTYAGQTNTPWSRRLKIPLSGICPPDLFRFTAGGGSSPARYRRTSRATPSFVIATGMMKPCSSKRISSMQTTR